VTVARLVERAEAVGTRLRLVLSARLTDATVAIVGRHRLIKEIGSDVGAIGRLEGAGLPRLLVTRLQLERKYKHAAEFGVLEQRGREGFDAFQNALQKFIREPSTTRAWGTYRGQPVLLNYNVESRLVVIQAPTGALVSGWRMTVPQLKYVVEKGVLGGD
jgi:hypothetical protein